MKVMRIVVVLVILAALGGFGAFLYVSGTRDRHDAGALAGDAADTGSPAAALGKLTPLDPPRPAPVLSFAARDGSPAQLADFHGHWLLVNLWATWCAPCVREMPSLDRLQAKLGDRLTVLAVSQDRGGAEVVDPFLQKLGLASLHIYLDPKAVVGKGLGARGLPTSFLVDGEGRVRAQLEGAAEWDSPPMLATLEHYFDNDAAGPKGADGRG
ncbi:MAG TPA: TlpA disulfide reductase family protein [Stellaceae bacterium]|nr:TlpA disulfide reductase family protein [Stellaceae bacterium]